MTTTPEYTLLFKGMEGKGREWNGREGEEREGKGGEGRKGKGRKGKGRGLEGSYSLELTRLSILIGKDSFLRIHISSLKSVRHVSNHEDDNLK